MSNSLKRNPLIWRGQILVLALLLLSASLVNLHPAIAQGCGSCSQPPVQIADNPTQLDPMMPPIDKGGASQAFADSIAAQIASLPRHIRVCMRKCNVTIRLARLPGEVKANEIENQPRGYSPGSTYREVPGFCSGTTATVFEFTVPATVDDAGVKHQGTKLEPTTASQGDPGTVFHEIGHALDHCCRFSASADFTLAWGEDTLQAERNAKFEGKPPFRRTIALRAGVPARPSPRCSRPCTIRHCRNTKLFLLRNFIASSDC